MNKRQRQKLQLKDHRDAFTATHVDTGIAFQIRVLRRQRNWSQQTLGEKLGAKTGAQSLVSRLETPGRTGYSLATLKNLASAFDVSLLVSFVSFGQATRALETLGPNSYRVPSFHEEIAMGSVADGSSRGTAKILTFSPLQLVATTSQLLSVPEPAQTLETSVTSGVAAYSRLRRMSSLST